MIWPTFTTRLNYIYNPWQNMTRDNLFQFNSQRQERKECLRNRDLPIFHASSQAVVTRRRHILNRQLTQAAGHHRHGPELAFGPQAGAVSVLSVQSVFRAPAYRSVVRAHKRHLHADGEPLRTALPQRKFKFFKRSVVTAYRRSLVPLVLRIKR